MEITTIISSEEEKVDLEDKIDTVAARGQVEKWLLDLERSMLKSIRAQVAVYPSVPYLRVTII